MLKFLHTWSHVRSHFFDFIPCKTRGVNPIAWLRDVLNRIPKHKANRLLEHLLEKDKKKRENLDFSNFPALVPRAGIEPACQ